MDSINRFAVDRKRQWAGSLVAIAAVTSLAMPLAFAQSVVTINGTPVDSGVVDVYLQSRVKKPLDQITEQERSVFLDELGDVLVLSSTDMAREFEQDESVAAQIDLLRMGILAQAVATKMAADIVINEEEIQATYQEQIKLGPSLQFKARHILVETQGEAIEIIKALIGGADFAELAKERSKDSSGPSGGDLGWFTPDRMVKPFSDAVAALDDGRYTTDPVQSKFGWHVILRDESRAAEPPPLEGVRDSIVTYLQSQKLRAMIDELKAAARKD